MASEELTMVGFISAVSKSMKKTADVFDAARRSGSDIDVPEGSRYIVISDTLATAIAINFRAIARILGGLDV